MYPVLALIASYVVVIVITAAETTYLVVSHFDRKGR